MRCWVEMAATLSEARFESNPPATWVVTMAKYLALGILVIVLISGRAALAERGWPVLAILLNPWLPALKPSLGGRCQRKKNL